MTITLEEVLKTAVQNKNLHTAKRNKNDEFYTQFSDIEKELIHYKEHFKDKVVLCNCDDPSVSNFVKYFALNFSFFGLKKLIITHYKESETSYGLEITSTIENILDIVNLPKIPLKQSGDFRSQECVELLKEADIVCTNPPFSLFREYVAQLIEYDKSFLIIGNFNAITYKEIFPLIKGNKLWVGVSPRSMVFKLPDGSSTQVNAAWFTNLMHYKRKEKLVLSKTYYGSETAYPIYDNYDAIEVSKVANIPKDFNGVIGVPITFLDKYNPDQFEIIKFRKGNDDKDLSIGGKYPYFRILITRK